MSSEKDIKYLFSLTEDEIDALYKIFKNPPKRNFKSLFTWETPCKNCPYNKGDCVCYNKTLLLIANTFGCANPYVIQHHK
jgi:hypothetical protein